jgi:hypothetical protein
MLAFMLIGFAWLLGAASDGLSNLAMWSLIVGALTPPLVAIVQRPTFNRTFRVIVMIAAAIIDGVVVSWLQGDLNFARFTNSALIAGVAIITAYHGIWKPSGIAPSIERASS